MRKGMILFTALHYLNFQYYPCRCRLDDLIMKKEKQSCLTVSNVANLKMWPEVGNLRLEL